MSTPHVKQCPTCPWKVDCKPLEDIPNGYSVQLQEAAKALKVDADWMVTLAKSKASPADLRLAVEEATDSLRAVRKALRVYNPSGDDLHLR